MKWQFHPLDSVKAESVASGTDKKKNEVHLICQQYPENIISLTMQPRKWTVMGTFRYNLPSSDVHYPIKLMWFSINLMICRAPMLLNPKVFNKHFRGYHQTDNDDYCKLTDTTLDSNPVCKAFFPIYFYSFVKSIKQPGLRVPT